MNARPELRVWSAADLASAPLPTPEKCGEFKITNDGFVTLRWGGYDYHIDLDRLDTPAKALDFICHLAHKTWADMTPNKIAWFIDGLRAHFGWPRT